MQGESIEEEEEEEEASAQKRTGTDALEEVLAALRRYVSCDVARKKTNNHWSLANHKVLADAVLHGEAVGKRELGAAAELLMRDHDRDWGLHAGGERQKREWQHVLGIDHALERL